MKTSSMHTWMSAALLIVALCCLAQGASKALLWFNGSRASGLIISVENTVSSRGAYWHRYQFSTAEGKRVDGTAMSERIPLYTSIRVAYLPIMPEINMPAYGAYAAVMGVVWSAAGLLVLCISRLFAKAQTKK